MTLEDSQSMTSVNVLSQWVIGSEVDKSFSFSPVGEVQLAFKHAGWVETFEITTNEGGEKKPNEWLCEPRSCSVSVSLQTSDLRRSVLKDRRFCDIEF